MTEAPETGFNAANAPEATVQAILQALTGLRYGQVTVIVQDGRVMQIDRTDRFRLPNHPTDARSGAK
jgi:hypothetical protein